MFERHINILAEKMRTRRSFIPPDFKVVRSLADAKMTPNRRVNFCTVNESARLLANSTAHFSSPEFINDHDAKE